MSANICIKLQLKLAIQNKECGILSRRGNTQNFNETGGLLENIIYQFCNKRKNQNIDRGDDIKKVARKMIRMKPIEDMNRTIAISGLKGEESCYSTWSLITIMNVGK